MNCSPSYYAEDFTPRRVFTTPIAQSRIVTNRQDRDAPPDATCTMFNVFREGSYIAKPMPNEPQFFPILPGAVIDETLGSYRPLGWYGMWSQYHRYITNSCSVDITFSSARSYPLIVFCWPDRNVNGDPLPTTNNILTNPLTKWALVPAYGTQRLTHTMTGDKLIGHRSRQDVNLHTTYINRFPDNGALDPADYNWHWKWGYIAPLPTDGESPELTFFVKLTYDVEFFDKRNQCLIPPKNE